jgi:hypothetical protein
MVFTARFLTFSVVPMGVTVSTTATAAFSLTTFLIIVYQRLTPIAAQTTLLVLTWGCLAIVPLVNIGLFSKNAD